MRTSKKDLESILTQCQNERTVLLLALQYSIIDDPAIVLRARDGDWSYRVNAYALTSAHGGIVVIRAKCHSNQQRDTVTAYYLDDSLYRFPFDLTPNLYARLNDVKNARHNLLFPGTTPTQ